MTAGREGGMRHLGKMAVLVFALALALALLACGSSAGGPKSSSEGSAETSASSSGSSTEAVEENAGASAEAGSELVGSPWVTSILSGNLPAAQPEVKDDLYAHYNYEYLAAHQDQNSSKLKECSSELRDAVTAIIEDESMIGHDLDQLRIFYNQAADVEALQATGLSEVKPYLDRIDEVTTLDEMNALLTADDFPFSPFVLANVTTNDTRAKNIVGISPNFVLCDPYIVGGTYYQNSDDPQVQANIEALLQNLVANSLVDLMAAGMDKDELKDAGAQLISFEKKHGQYLDAVSTYLNADYGALAEEMRNSYCTLDEMCALASNFPMKETLDKMWKGGSETYFIDRDWLEAFNGLWTEENLATIKLVAKAKVLGETRPYRDPTPMNDVLESSGQVAPSAEDFAYTACTSLDTLANVVAKIYVDDALGDNAKARLEALSGNLIATYKDLVENTTWMGEESRQRIIEKLDNMTINVLEPQGGYFDYGNLELTPTEEGGTLFSNYLKLKQYRYDCESKLVNQPAVAASPWFGAAPTMANSFYDPTSNSINIYPGFVTSQIYTDEMTDADLLAGAGWSIGHEISHGFDYEGSQLDAYGQPNPVFTDADVDAFVLKCATLAMYYSKIEVMPDQMVNGQLVVGEAGADLSGMQACLELASKTEGFDYDDFFEGCSNVWAEVVLAQYLTEYLADVHPMNHLRVNVSAQMYDAIYEAFGVAEGDGMYLAPGERIVMWGSNA